MKTTTLFLFVALLALNLGMVGVAAATGPADRPAQGSSSTPAVRIVKPVENGVVSLGAVPVQVTAENLHPNSPYQWQFYLDGAPAGTAAAGSVTYTLSITVSGPHSIKAALADAQAQQVASAQVNVTAAPRTPNVAFDAREMGPVMAVLTLGILLLIILSLRLTRRSGS